MALDLMHTEMTQTVAEIVRQAGDLRHVVFVSGNFDVIHPGHLRILKFAAECGNFLVVGVNDQAHMELRVPSAMRLEGVQAISLVDHAFLLPVPPEDFLAQLKPAVVVKGKEFETQYNPEQDILESNGGKLLFSSGELRFSSFDLLQHKYTDANFSTISKPTGFLKRHGFTMQDLKSQLPHFDGMQVVVVGDLIVDEYIDCQPLGMSQEDPTIVVTPIENRKFVGGSGIVAAHARGLGGDVSYITVAGADEGADFAHEALDRYGVKSTIVTDDNRITTVKQRFRAEGKTLLRVSHLRQHDVSAPVAARLLAAVKRSISQADLLIFSDFNYGCLPQHLVAEIIRLGEENNVMMVADSQASSQISDISRFSGMRLITPTEREARLALQDWSSGLVVLADALRRKSCADNVVITLGSEGILVHAQNMVDCETDRLPAFNTAPKDPAGAGDSFLTCGAMALCAGVDVWQSVYLGALAAACQTARVGNTPLTQADIVTEIELP